MLTELVAGINPKPETLTLRPEALDVHVPPQNLHYGYYDPYPKYSIVRSLDRSGKVQMGMTTRRGMADA